MGNTSIQSSCPNIPFLHYIISKKSYRITDYLTKFLSHVATYCCFQYSTPTAISVAESQNSLVFCKVFTHIYVYHTQNIYKGLFAGTLSISRKSFSRLHATQNTCTVFQVERNTFGISCYNLQKAYAAILLLCRPNKLHLSL
jgi:hypothetical protein